MSQPNLRVVERDGMDRGKALEAALGQIERAFGKGSIMRLGQKDAVAVIASIPTGSISIDYALGVGGMPRGRRSSFPDCRTSRRSSRAAG